MAITLREFVTKWGFEVNDSELKKLDKSFAESRKNMQTLSDNISSFGKKALVGITLPFAALSGFSIKAAADAADFEARFRTIFKGIGDDGVKAINKFGESIGLSSSEVQKLVGGSGQMLRNLGFSETSALDLGKSVAELSADVAEFNNIEGGTEAVQQKIIAALAGRTQGLKELGVIIDQDTLKAQVAANKQAGLTFQSEKQAEAFAILTQVTKQTANAKGAFTEATDDVDVAMAKLRARTTNVAITFGKMLIPVFLKVVSVAERVVQFFDSMNERTRTIILVLAGLAAAIGPLLLVFASVLNAVMAIRTAMVLFGNASLLAALKFIALPLLIAAAVVAVGLIIEDLYGFFVGKDSLFGLIVQAVDDLVNHFQEKFPILGTIVRGVFEGMLLPIRIIVGAIRAVSALIGTIVGGGGIMNGFKAAAGEFTNSVFDSFTALAQGKDFSLTRALGIGGIRKGEKDTELSTGFLGGLFGGPEAIPPSPSSVANTNAPVTQSVNAPITVTVPPGTPPQAVGPAVRQGISDGLSNLFRETARQTATPVTN